MKYMSLIVNQNIIQSLEKMKHTLSFELYVQCQLAMAVGKQYGGTNRVRKDKDEVGSS